MSAPKQLDNTDIQRWLLNLRIFLTPLVLIYLIPVAGIIETPNHLTSLTDFGVNPVMAGAMLTYVMNAVIDLLRKYYQGQP